ncbi:MAG TPA: restriction endonuclease subunit S [Pontiellaceae bacterium]|nr:restriction endonuclease subunit S [Pontiellaceae bacterium]
MKLQDMCEIRMGYAFRSGIKHSPAGNIPVIQPKDIDNNGILQVEDVYRVEMSEVNPEHILKSGDVLLSNRGRFAATTYTGQIETCVASGALLVLTVKKDAPVLPEYLTLYFNSQEGKRQLGRLDQTTTIPHISRKNLEQIDMPVPPIERQETLVALERAKLLYTTLTNRKIELTNNIINQQLI